MISLLRYQITKFLSVRLYCTLYTVHTYTLTLWQTWGAVQIIFYVIILKKCMHFDAIRRSGA
jgi:hypothetical protein